MPVHRVVAVIRQLVTRIRGWRITRTVGRYGSKHGELLAGGMSVTALFSAFAALYVGFALAGLYLQAAPDVRDSFVALLNTNAPGLIDTGNGGAINLDDLYAARILGWSGIVAAVVLTLTALGWLSATRDAVRIIFALPAEKTFFLLLKLKDLGLILAFGVAMLVSVALSIVSTRTLTAFLRFLGLADGSWPIHWALEIAGLLIVLALDTVVVGTLLRVLSGVVIPWRRLLVGSLLAAVVLGILKIVATGLIGRAGGGNPLLASFAAIVGLLIWFSLVCRVILLAASWIAVEMNDHGLTGARLPKLGAERDRSSTHDGSASR